MNKKTKLFGLQKEVELKRQNERNRRRDIKLKKETNSTRYSSYSGKRFLGLSPSKQPVWVKLSLDKNSKLLTMSTTHNLEILLDKDALLAQSRLSLKLNEKVNQFDLRIALKDTRRNEGGKVTKTTLNYIQKLIDVVDSKSYPAFVNSQPSKLFFQYVASCVYPGDSNLNTGITWVDVCTYWGLPSGEYFTMERFSKVDISEKNKNNYQYDAHVKDYLNNQSRLAK